MVGVDVDDTLWVHRRDVFTRIVEQVLSGVWSVCLKVSKQMAGF